MESILTANEEVQPLNSRHTKSSLASATNARGKTLDASIVGSIFLDYYESMKIVVRQRSVYIFGVFNLVLAGAAIVCVVQAEDHPEYFALVYIAIGVFVFYIGTIIFIIILQFIETSRARRCSPVKITVFEETDCISNPIVVESMNTTTYPVTRLLRSQTIPLSSLPFDRESTPPPIIGSSSTSSTTLKIGPPMRLTRFESRPVDSPHTHSSPCPSLATITNSDSAPHISPLIKPIPLKFHSSSDHIRSDIRYLQYS